MTSFHAKKKELEAQGVRHTMDMDLKGVLAVLEAGTISPDGLIKITAGHPMLTVIMMGSHAARRETEKEDYILNFATWEEDEFFILRDVDWARICTALDKTNTTHDTRAAEYDPPDVKTLPKSRGQKKREKALAKVEGDIKKSLQ